MKGHALMNFVTNGIFTFSAIAVVFFAVLVVWHFFRKQRQKLSQRRKAKMKKKIFLYLDNPLDDLKKALTDSSKSDAKILVEIAADLLRNLKGKAYVNLLKLFSEVGLYDYVRDSLFSNSRRRYSSVIGVSSHIAGDEIKQRLIDLLDDDSFMVRYSAAEALAYTHDINLLPILIKKFTDGEDFSHRMIADIFDLLGNKIEDEMAELLTKKGVPNRLKMAALLVLAKHSDGNKISKVVQSVCVDKNRELSALAFSTLADVKVEVPVELLKNGAKSKSWQTRQNVARCAAHSFPSSAEILMNLLKDKNSLVGLQAAKSLMGNGSRGVAILKAVSHEKSLDGVRAAMILAEEGSDGRAA